MEIEVVRLKTPFGGPNETYIYIINSEIMIDGGFCSLEHANKLEEFKIEHYIITHHHIDHVGVIFFSKKEVMIHPLERRYLKVYSEPERFIDEYSKVFQSFGVPVKYVKTLEILVSMNLRPKARMMDIHSIENLKVIETPGHTPGHVSLLLDGNLFSGDFVLSDTTPNIGFYPDYERGVADYLNSLRKVLKFEIDRIYPAHEKIIRNPQKRIYELIDHCVGRTDEACELIGTHPLKLEDVAANISWSVGDYEDLDDFNRFMAVCETLAYSHYLEENGRIRRKFVDSIIQFVRS